MKRVEGQVVFQFVAMPELLDPGRAFERFVSLSMVGRGPSFPRQPSIAPHSPQYPSIDVGQNQVAIRLARPFAPFLQTTAEAMFVFPRHIWEDVADPQTFVEPEAFIGSGAYRLVEYSQEEGTYLFEANPDFFLGAPYVQRIEFVPVSDPILALSNREIAAFD